MDRQYDVLIIGGGAAGLAAALYAARFRLKTAVIAKEYGGTGNIAHQVDNWIGEPGIAGWDLMQKFIAHVKSYDVPLIEGEVTKALKEDDQFTIALANGDVYTSRSLILSNGMVHRKLGVQGEEEYAGKGVHYCYTCDGPLYKGKILAVVGGSDSAVLGTIFLSQYAGKVYTIFRKDELTAEPISVEKLKLAEHVEFVPRANVAEIIGENKRVTQLKLDTGRVIEVNGVFIEIGHLPLNSLAKDLAMALDPRGYIVVDRTQKTNISGAFAAGDITNATELKQFITSAAEGSIAAQSAYNYLNSLHGGYR